MSDLQRTRKSSRKAASARKRAPKMAPADREKNIIEQAIQYFARVGFEGSTRDLAKQIGITQSLLYRYFPNKQALIDTVYQHVYLTRWDPGWETLLRDRSRPLESRLKQYYREYSHVMLRHDWIRILIFAGLKQENINDRLFSMLTEHVFSVVVAEFHAEANIVPTSNNHDDLKIEAVWALHASIFYIGMRKWVYQTPTPSDMDALLDVLIGGLIHNLHAICQLDES